MRQSAVACVCVCVCVVACFCQMGGLKWPAGCCSMPWMGEGKGRGIRLAAGGRNFIHRFINVRNALLATPPPCTLPHSVFISSSTNVATLGVGGGGLLGLERGVAATTAVALFWRHPSVISNFACAILMQAGRGRAKGEEKRGRERQGGTAVRAACACVCSVPLLEEFHVIAVSCSCYLFFYSWWKCNEDLAEYPLMGYDEHSRVEWKKK